MLSEANLSTRMMSFSIDSVCVVALGISAQWVLFSYLRGQYSYLFVPIAYFFVAPLAMGNRTLGQFMLRLRIVNEDGNVISYGLFVVRLLTAFVLFPFCWIAYLNRRRKTVHDMIWRTVVVHEGMLTGGSRN